MKHLFVSVKLCYREPRPAVSSLTDKPVPLSQCTLHYPLSSLLFCLSQQFYHKIGARPNSHLCVDIGPQTNLDLEMTTVDQRCFGATAQGEEVRWES